MNNNDYDKNEFGMDADIYKDDEQGFGLDSEILLHKAHLERMQILEEAMTRAEAGVASKADWETIRYEGGLGVKLKMGDSNGIHNKIKRVVM